MKNKKAELTTILYILFFIFVIIGIIISIIYGVYYATSNGNETITIKEKWVKYHGNDAKYLVSSTTGEVYQITDSWIYLRFNSSDLYAYLESGMICQVKFQGFRFGFMSDYKNIIEANCNG